MDGHSLSNVLQLSLSCDTACLFFPLAGTQQQEPAQHLLHTVPESLCHCGIHPRHQHRHVSGQCLQDFMFLQQQWDPHKPQETSGIAAFALIGAQKAESKADVIDTLGQISATLRQRFLLPAE